jgi:hypothetical protein
MSKVIKRSLSSKGTPAVFDAPDFFKNFLTIPSDVQKELDAAGLEGRWIDYKQYTDSGNMHMKGWEIYRRKTPTSDALSFGSNPDGIIRRKGAVLATRPKAMCQQHRSWLKTKAEAAVAHNERKADELRQAVREAGGDAVVHEGYEDNE